jgi:hypothetical protein
VEEGGARREAGEAVTDVFVKVWPQNRIRLLMAFLAIERIAQLPGARVRLLLPSLGLGHTRMFGSGSERMMKLAHDRLAVAPENFHTESKSLAARAAESDVFVVIDDDHLPIGDGWLARGVAQMEKRKDYVLLASLSVNNENPPDLILATQRTMGYTPDFDEELLQTWGLGTPYFARRGELPHELFAIPRTTAHTYDPQMSERALAYGKLGFMLKVRHNHLGYGHSTVSAQHWEA